MTHVIKKHVNTLKKYGIDASVKEDILGNNLIVEFKIPKIKKAEGGIIGIDDALAAAAIAIISAVTTWGTNKAIKAIEGEACKTTTSRRPKRQKKKLSNQQQITL